jgi:ParB-like chromosome segregation protein Spo0J
VADLESHTYADCYPMMREHEFKGLCDDIRANGLHIPITLHEGRILDGRNRYRACLRIKVEPRFVPFAGTDEDALRFVVSMNHARRDMDEYDRALSAQRVAEQFTILERRARKEARRMAQGLMLPGVSPDAMEAAAHIDKHGSDELKDAASSGDVSFGTAAKLVEQPDEVQRAAIKMIRDDLARETEPYRAEVEADDVVTKEVEVNEKGRICWRRSAERLEKSARLEDHYTARMMRLVLPEAFG